MAVSFPNSFLQSEVFVFKGVSGDALVSDFCDVQDIGEHVMYIRDYLDWNEQQEEFSFTESIFASVMAGEPISTNDAKRFFSLCPEVCRLLDFIEAEDALQRLLKKYPNALSR